MKLYYYSIGQKAFFPLFPRTTNEEELRDVNRYRTTTKGGGPLAWITAAANWTGISALGGAIASGLGTVLMAGLNALAHGIFYAAGQFLLGCGYLLDMSIDKTISSDMYDKLEVIKVGWSTVRDFSNMFFIFALLYIAIKTILGMGGSNTKRWVAHLIIAAVLINFSLFGTKVVIDAGNVLAMGLWAKMEMTPGGNDPSAAQHLIQGLKIQSIENPVDSKGVPIKLTDFQIFLTYIGGALFCFVAGYVFLAGAIMMIVRTVSLIFVLIVSPFAFLSFALPVGGGFGSKWLSKLIGNTFVAPAFLAMLYLVTIIVNGLDLNNLADGKGASLGGALAGDIGSYMIIYNYVILIMLILASLTVANSVSSGAGSTGSALAKRALGGAVAYGAAGTGKLYRSTGGRWAANKLNDLKLHEEAKRTDERGAIARRQIATYTKMANSTGDIRASRLGKSLTSGLGMVGITTGGPKSDTFNTNVGGKYGSYVGQRDKDEKRGEKTIQDEAKMMFPDNPQAQKQYIESKLDGKWNKTVHGTGWADTARNKKAKDALDKEAAIKDDQDKLKAMITQLKDNGDTMAKDASDKLKTEIQGLFTKLGGKESLGGIPKDMMEMMNKEVSKLSDGEKKNLDMMAGLMNRQQVAQMAADPEKYGGALTNMTSRLMANGSDETRGYIITQNKLGNPQLRFDSSAEIQNRIAEYNKLTPPTETSTEEERARYFADKERHTAAIQDIVGAMKPRDVARLSDDVKSHETLVQSYTDKHFDEIANYHKNIKVDRTDAEKLKTKNLLDDIRAKARKTPSGKRYMDSDKGAAYGGGKPKVDVKAKEKASADAKAALDEAVAKREAANKNPYYVPGEKDAAKKAHEDAQKAYDKAQAELASAKRTASSKSSTGDTGDDTVDDADDTDTPTT